MDRAIGIDIGTTSISLAVIDAQSRAMIQAVTLPNSSMIAGTRDWERIQDESVISRTVRTTLDDLISGPDPVCSIGLTGQMHGILYVDQAGNCLSPLYTWQDGRGLQPDKNGIPLTEEIRRTCGAEASTGYGLVTHLYNCRHGLVPKNASKICTISDYIGMELTHRPSPLVHSSNAASMGFFDVKKGSFRKEVLDALEIPADILPETATGFRTIGRYRGIDVSIALGDNQAGFLGSVGTKEHTALLNMGTGGQISILSDRYFESPGIEARPYMENRFLLAGSSLCGGRAYGILEAFFRDYMKAALGEAGPQYSVMEKLAANKPQTHGMLVKTTFQGTRADPALTGSITGLTADNFTPEGLVYGVLEGMARELYELSQVIRAGTGIRIDALVASGNGYRKNRLLQEISREMFGVPLSMAPYEEEAAYGAAVSSLHG